jgi:hypothetical protein
LRPARLVAQQRGGLAPRPAAGVEHPAACRNRPPDAHPLTRDTCGYRLDTVPAAEPATSLDLEPILNLQSHLLHLLRGDQATTSVGEPATAAQYVIDLRVLSCLITASWPTAATLVRGRGHADLIDEHVQHTRRHVNHLRRIGRKARDHAHYDTPPAAAAHCAALLSLADTLTRVGDPDTLRNLLAPLVALLPACGHDWIKQFLHGDGHCSPGLQTALGPTVGAAHVIARTGIASFTTKRRRYPRVRRVRFALGHLPQRIPVEWIDTYFTAFTDLPPRSLHHVIVARLATWCSAAHPPTPTCPTRCSRSASPPGRPCTRWPTSPTGSPPPTGRPPSPGPSTPSPTTSTPPSMT